ncbi:MAG: hypothetical protein Q4G04_01355 [bacterium]|nr:hypothetical protein [bacterium]
MNESIVLEFKIGDEFIDNALIPKKEILKYDINYCFEKVEEKIDNYITAQCDFPNIKRPTITSNYEVRYECYVPRKTDKVGSYVINKVDKEIEIVRLYSDIATALESLSKDEFNYFLQCLYYKKSENYVITLMDTTRFLFGHIKNSCILKLAKSLDVAKKL